MSNTSESLIWMRQYGQVQARVSGLLQAQQKKIDQLERQVLRLNALRVIDRTQHLWALVANDAAADVANASLLTHHVICKTGCEGHGHPWLTADGECTRTGKSCSSLAVTAFS